MPRSYHTCCVLLTRAVCCLRALLRVLFCCAPQVNEGLAVSQPAERTSVGGLLEREFKQEKVLEAREREALRARRAAEEDGKAGKGDDGAPSGGKRDRAMEKILKKVDRDFLTLVKEAEDRDGRPP